jgi:hypothetical protein
MDFTCCTQIGLKLYGTVIIYKNFFNNYDFFPFKSLKGAEAGAEAGIRNFGFPALGPAPQNL